MSLLQWQYNYYFIFYSKNRLKLSFHFVTFLKAQNFIYFFFFKKPLIISFKAIISYLLYSFYWRNKSPANWKIKNIILILNILTFGLLKCALKTYNICSHKFQYGVTFIKIKYVAYMWLFFFLRRTSQIIPMAESFVAICYMLLICLQNLCAILMNKLCIKLENFHHFI